MQALALDGAYSPALQALIGRSLHSKFGLINAIEEDLPRVGHAGIVIVRAKIAPPAYFRMNRPSPVKTTESGTGAAFDREAACWAAIGEAIERYCGSIYWQDQIRFATGRELRRSAIDLSRLIRIGRPEVKPYDPTKERGWVKGCELLTGVPCYLPAMLCYLGYQPQNPDEVIAQNDSTGLACGQSFADASLRGLCELIERDVFASNWMLSRKAPRLVFSNDSLQNLPLAVQKALSSQRVPVSLFHVDTIFGVHVIMGLARNQQGLAVVSAAASPDVSRAVIKATAEALHGWTLVEWLTTLPEVKDATEIRSTTDHARYYLSSKQASILADMFVGSELASFDQIKAGEAFMVDTHSICAALNAQGIVAAAIDLTTHDVSELGLSVARVIAPGLQPLVFGAHCTEAPDQRRLDYWRARWQIDGRNLNPHPHPFP